MSQKMPTIQLYKSGEKVAEHIAAEGAIDALEKVWSRCRGGKLICLYLPHQRAVRSLRCVNFLWQAVH